MDWTARRQAFRGLLAGGCIHPASVFDPISARLAEDIGYEAGMFAGSIAALTVLGAPDLVVLTLTELAEQVLRITRAATLPVLVDADHGFGNALSVMRTVAELECAGAAALTIEDTLLPRAYGAAGTALIPREEGVGKMRAAVAARRDGGLVVVARTGALSVDGVAEAVERARLYAATGVDALFFTGVTEVAQVAALREVTALPFILGGAKGVPGREALADLGVRIALQGHHPFMAAMRAVDETLRALRAGVAPSALENQPSAALLPQVTRAAGYDAATRDFLGA